MDVHHPEQLWWPELALRKADAVAYYDALAPTILPHLRDRPLTIKQHYNGPRSPFRWLKDKPPDAPGWVPTTDQPAKSRDGGIVRYVVVRDRRTLLWAIDYGAIDLHVWTSRVDRADRPDVVLLDLDPHGAPFAAVVEASLLLHEALTALGLRSVPLTTGGDGMHVRVPIARRHTYEEVRRFVRTLADMLRRVGADSVGLDVKMNGHGQQVVAPYSIRPVPAAAVATPLSWDEVTDTLDPDSFAFPVVLERVARLGDLAAPLVRTGRRSPESFERVRPGHPVAMAEAKTTTEHDEIRRWVESRGGRPARVRETGADGDPGILRIDFRDPDEGLEEISWDDWFEAFEENRLAFLYQDEGESRFNKLVKRPGSNGS